MRRLLCVVSCLAVCSTALAAEKAAEVWEQEKVLCELGVSETVDALALSTDGEYIAIGSSTWDRVGGERIRNSQRLIRLSDGQPLYTKTTEELSCLDLFFTPDGQTIVSHFASPSRSREVLVEQENVRPPAPLNLVAVWGEKVRPESSGNCVLFWQAIDGERLMQVGTGLGCSCHMAFNPQAYLTPSTPSGSQSRHVTAPAIAASGWPSLIRLYDVEGNHLYDLADHWDGDLTWEGDLVRSLAFSPDGMLLASTGLDGTVRLWNLAERMGVILKGRLKRGERVVFSPDGEMLAAADDLSVTIRRWKVATGKPLRALTERGRKHSGGWPPTVALAFSPDSQLLADGGLGERDSMIRLWSMATGKQVAQLDLRDPTRQESSGLFASALVFDASGRLFSGSADRVIIWRRAGETVADTDVTTAPK